MSKPTPSWISLLNSKLSESMKANSASISYALATLDSEGSPMVRFVVHRGFLNERRPSEDPALSKNPPSPSESPSAIMIFNTDLLSPKVSQLMKDNRVQLSWWMEPAKYQFRAKGRGWLLPCDPAEGGENLEERQRLQNKLDEVKERLTPPGLSTFSFPSEHSRHFSKLSPPLRASFLRPTPGSALPVSPSLDSLPLELPTSDGEPSEEEEKSRRRMVLVCVEVEEVDVCDLSGGTRTEKEEKEGKGRDRRWKWEKMENGEWKEWEVVP